MKALLLTLIIVVVVLCFAPSAETAKPQDMLLLGAGAPGAIPVNLYIDMEAGTGGNLITTTDASNATKGSGCTYSLTPDPLTRFFIDATDLGALLKPVSVGGTVYTGSGGTRSWRWDLDTAFSTNTQDVICTVTTNSQRVSVSALIKTSLNVNTFQNHDLIEIRGSSSQDCVLQFKDNSGGGGGYGFLAHGVTTGGSSSGGNVVATTTNTTYMVTALYDSVAGTCELKVYNASTKALVGTSTGAVISTGINATSFRIGNNNHAGESDGKDFWIDQVLFDWTNARYPLGI